MADITMCEDHECPLKHECYRYTAPANPYRQSYFRDSPNPEHKDFCEYKMSIYPKQKQGGQGE